MLPLISVDLLKNIISEKQDTPQRYDKIYFVNRLKSVPWMIGNIVPLTIVLTPVYTASALMTNSLLIGYDNLNVRKFDKLKIIYWWTAKYMKLVVLLCRRCWKSDEEISFLNPAVYTPWRQTLFAEVVAIVSDGEFTSTKTQINDGHLQE